MSVVLYWFPYSRLHPPNSQISPTRHSMDSLAQELIDEIINHIPRNDMFTSSLIAMRWTRRSQQRNFESVEFMFDNLTLWEINIPQDLDGIPSYVHNVQFQSIFRNLERGIFRRILKTFRSMISLEMVNTDLPPDDLTVPVSLGEFGKRITRLALFHVDYESFPAITSLIFSLPNLEELITSNIDSQSYEPSQIIPDTSQREPLELFMVWGVQEEAYIAIAQWKLVSRRLSLDPHDEGMELLINASSETVVALTLLGMQLPRAFGQENILTCLLR